MLLPSDRWNSHILLLLFCNGRCYCPVADGKDTHFLLFVVMAGVIAQWQMEWPLQGGSDLSPGRCYSQGADGCSWVCLF